MTLRRLRGGAELRKVICEMAGEILWGRCANAPRMLAVAEFASDKGADSYADSIGAFLDPPPFLIRQINDAALVGNHAVHGTRFTVHA